MHSIFLWLLFLTTTSSFVFSQNSTTQVDISVSAHIVSNVPVQIIISTGSEQPIYNAPNSTVNVEQCEITPTLNTSSSISSSSSSIPFSSSLGKSSISSSNLPTYSSSIIGSSSSPNFLTSSSSHVPTVYYTVSAGQSNQLDFGAGGCDSSDTEPPGVFMWDLCPSDIGFNKTSLNASCEISNLQCVDYGATNVGTFSILYGTQNLNVNVDLMVIVQCSYGGSSFSSWQSYGSWYPGYITGVPDLGANCISYVNTMCHYYALKGYACQALNIGWLEGESDDGSLLGTGIGITWTHALQWLMNTFRTQMIGASLVTPVLVFQLSQCLSATVIGYNGQSSLFAAINNITNNINYAAIVNSTGFCQDNIHYDSEFQRILGQRSYNQFFLAQNNSFPASWTGDLAPVAPLAPAFVTWTSTLANASFYSAVPDNAIFFSFLFNAPFDYFNFFFMRNFLTPVDCAGPNGPGFALYTTTSGLIVSASNAFGSSPNTVSAPTPIIPPPNAADYNFHIISTTPTSVVFGWLYEPNDIGNYMFFRLTCTSNGASCGDSYYVTPGFGYNTVVANTNYTFTLYIGGCGGIVTTSILYNTATYMVSSSSSSIGSSSMSSSPLSSSSLFSSSMMSSSSVISSSSIASYTPFLLDIYPGAVGAYSTRQLYHNFHKCCQVQVSGTGPTYDVYFNSNGYAIQTTTDPNHPLPGLSNLYITIIYDQSQNGNNIICTPTNTFIYNAAGDSTSNGFGYIQTTTQWSTYTSVCSYSLTIPTTMSIYTNLNPDNTNFAVVAPTGNLVYSGNSITISYPNSDVGNQLYVTDNTYTNFGARQTMLISATTTSSSAAATYYRNNVNIQNMGFSGDSVPATETFNSFMSTGAVTFLELIIWNISLPSTICNAIVINGTLAFPYTPLSSSSSTGLSSSSLLSSSIASVSSSAISSSVISLSSSSLSSPVAQRLLDVYSGAMAAYSVRQLYHNFSKCCQVQINGTGSTYDVYFNSNGYAIQTTTDLNHPLPGLSNLWITKIYDQSRNGNDITCTPSSNIIYNAIGDSTSTGYGYIQTFTQWSNYFTGCTYNGGSLVVPATMTVYTNLNPDNTNFAVVNAPGGQLTYSGNTITLSYPNSDVGNQLGLTDNTYTNFGALQAMAISVSATSTSATGLYDRNNANVQAMLFSGDAVPASLSFNYFMNTGAVSFFDMVFWPFNQTLTNMQGIVLNGTIAF